MANGVLPHSGRFMPANSLEQFTAVKKNGVPAERTERRKRTRIQVHWPVRFLKWDTTDVVEAVTHDLSSRGFYCLVNTPFIPGEFRICILGVPGNYSKDPCRTLPVECKIRIVRVDVHDNGFYGVGCQIEDYRFMDTV